MWKYNDSNELMHFGKKGMKWGKRSGPSKSQQIKTARKERPKLASKNFEAKQQYDKMMSKERVSDKTYNEVVKKRDVAQRNMNASITLAQQRTGAEKTAATLGVIGALAITSLALTKIK